MKDSSQKADTQSAGPPAWLMATQWGLNLVALTCVFGFGGYYLGENLLGGSFFSIGLMLVGLIGGFSMGLYRIFKASEQMDVSTSKSEMPLDDKPDADKN